MESNNLLYGVNLFYPGAKEWMWSYCICLGPFTDSTGKNFDLGLYLSNDSESPCAAIVYGNNEGNYLSGSFDNMSSESRENYIEAYRRAKELNLI